MSCLFCLPNAELLFWFAPDYCKMLCELASVCESCLFCLWVLSVSCLLCLPYDELLFWFAADYCSLTLSVLQTG